MVSVMRIHFLPIFVWLQLVSFGFLSLSPRSVLAVPGTQAATYLVVKGTDAWVVILVLSAGC